MRHQERIQASLHLGATTHLLILRGKESINLKEIVLEAMFVKILDDESTSWSVHDVSMHELSADWYNARYKTTHL